jgi:carbamoyltransferase
MLGPDYSDAEILAYLEEIDVPYERLSPRDLVDSVAGHLARGEIVGWFQGRMEFGPRALGGRSILGDPRDPGMQARMNRKTKYREGFRPFAPAVLEEHCGTYFEHDRPSPYMTFVVPVRDARVEASAGGERLTGFDRLKLPRSGIPAVTHVDGTARIQTVGDDASPRFRELLRAFHRLTGCPVLINTSFNVRGEPIVCTPRDAFACFLHTDIDRLAMGSFLLDGRAKRAVDLGLRATLERDWGSLGLEQTQSPHALDD